MFSQKLKASIVKVNVEFENERVKGEITVLGWHKSKTSNENVKYQNLKLPLLRQKQNAQTFNFWLMSAYFNQGL